MQKEKKLVPLKWLLAHFTDCQKFISLPLFFTIFHVGQGKLAGDSTLENTHELCDLSKPRLALEFKDEL
jgi:hypothetical protein